MLFGIAKVISRTYGHGDFGTERVIGALGVYGSEGLPPVFRTPQRAEAWIAEKRLGSEYIVVPLQFIEE